MFCKNCVCVPLMAISLLQTAWSLPTPTDDLCLMASKHEMVQFSEKDNLLTPSTQLYKFATTSWVQLSIKYVQGGKAISEQLLKNEEILSSNSPKILEFQQNLTKFEENYANCHGLEALADLAEIYSNATSFYFDDDAILSDADDKFILNILQKYKSYELDMQYEKDFALFGENFKSKFESLRKKLVEEGGEESKKLSDWFEHFKTLQSYDDQVEAFEQFYELYD